MTREPAIREQYPEERGRLLKLGTDLEAAWRHPAATVITRKRIIRVVLREVVARVEGEEIQLLLHWQGGDHTRLAVKKNRRGQTRWVVEPEIVDLIRACARLMPDKAIDDLPPHWWTPLIRSSGSWKVDDEQDEAGIRA